jgi:putative chitinase
MKGYGMFILQKEQLKAIIPQIKDLHGWYNVLSVYLPKYDINTKERVAAFIAQCAHESSGFNVVEENLNYSAEQLVKTFKRRVANVNVANYARNPRKIANLVYADRMGKGPENTGDGWLYRGRGLIQVTGKSNYQGFAKFKGISLADAIEYLSTKDGAIESACWFWQSRNINKLADAKDIVGMSKVINGGTNGLDDRISYYNRAIDVLTTQLASTPPGVAKTNVATSGQSGKVQRILKIGSKGAAVMRLQKVLGITADGDFGPATENALKKWQEDNGLVSDGIAGPLTFSKLFVYKD